MCGIGGIFHLNPNQLVDEQHLNILAETIKHRGPNNQGIFIHQHAGLAYRRLSIIDTTEQAQPILTNETQTLRISLNGEIYNFPQLKDELLSKGHRFYTGTDTEMILHLYEEEGPECVQRLNGIFAFAILDIRDGSLFIARDQMGIKPLYYTLQENSFVFASEIKALLSIPWVKRSVSYEALNYYFKYRFVPDPLTMFKDIYKLKPGHYMQVSKESGVNIQPYWSLSSAYRGDDSRSREILSDEENVIQMVRNTLQDAVKRQLLADVPLGAFLSGGIDSSIIVGIMSGLMSAPVKTFSVGFSESQYNETNYARQISERFKTDHREIVLTPDHVKSLPDIVYHLDEPLADPAAVPTYFLSKLARERVTVVLTGEGGDELFAGYKEDFNYGLSGFFSFLPPNLRHAMAQFFLELSFDTGRTRIYRSILEDRARAEHILTDVFRFEDPPILPSSGVNDSISDHNRAYSFESYWQHAQGLDWLSKLLYLETKIWLPGDPLMKVDKMSMAHALEARVPILDMEMVKLAVQIPSRLKNKNGTEKYLLRKAFVDLLPDEIFNRPKTAFEIPVKEWLQNELAPMVEEYLSEEKLGKSQYLDTRKVREMIKQHRDGHADYRYEIWAVLVFQIWWEKWFK